MFPTTTEKAALCSLFCFRWFQRLQIVIRLLSHPPTKTEPFSLILKSVDLKGSLALHIDSHKLSSRPSWQQRHRLSTRPDQPASLMRERTKITINPGSNK
jgi:hypothetical protein